MVELVELELRCINMQTADHTEPDEFILKVNMFLSQTIETHSNHLDFIIAHNLAAWWYLGFVF